MRIARGKHGLVFPQVLADAERAARASQDDRPNPAVGGDVADGADQRILQFDGERVHRIGAVQRHRRDAISLVDQQRIRHDANAIARADSATRSARPGMITTLGFWSWVIVRENIGSSRPSIRLGAAFSVSDERIWRSSRRHEWRP
jgi:hypothetical protein